MTIFLKQPEDFHPTVMVASCFCEFESTILMLRRHPDKPQGTTWGLPAGKMEHQETPREAAVREVFEEVGIKLEVDELTPVGQLFIRLSDIDYVFFMFRRRFTKRPPVVLESDAHSEAKWVTLPEAYQLPLIIGGAEALKCYESISI